MSDLDDLYQEVILDHNRRPRNFRELPTATRRIEGHNPLCGDRLTLFLELDGDLVRDIAFQGSGCAISRASASLMTETVKGKRTAEVEQIFELVHDLVTGRAGRESDPRLGKLAVLSGVSRFPVRVKCAALAWHALRSALRGGGEQVSTEEGSES